MKIRPVEAVLFHTDGKTVASRNFANVPKTAK